MPMWTLHKMDRPAQMCNASHTASDLDELTAIKSTPEHYQECHTISIISTRIKGDGFMNSKTDREIQWSWKVSTMHMHWACDISNTKGGSPPPQLTWEAWRKLQRHLYTKPSRYNGKTTFKALWCKDNSLISWRASFQTYPWKQPSTTSQMGHSSSCWTLSWIRYTQRTISPGGARNSPKHAHDVEEQTTWAKHLVHVYTCLSKAGTLGGTIAYYRQQKYSLNMKSTPQTLR